MFMTGPGMARRVAAVVVLTALATFFLVAPVPAQAVEPRYPSGCKASAYGPTQPAWDGNCWLGNSSSYANYAAYVQGMQYILNAAGFPAGPTDGIFGVRTQIAVEDFQRFSGLSADGIVGPNTWGDLRLYLRYSGPAGNSYYYSVGQDLNRFFMGNYSTSLGYGPWGYRHGSSGVAFGLNPPA